MPDALLGRMQVVLEEVVANVARHAYPPGRPGPVQVVFDADPEKTSLTVTDSGLAFDPTAAPLPAPDPTRLGGWGLGLIRRYCPDMTYIRRNGHNRLTLSFSLYRPA